MQLYKPNKAVKGSALSVNFSAKTDKDNIKGDKSFYFQLVSQTGWSDETGNGTFKDGKKITCKFAPHEISGMLAAMKRNTTLEDAMGVKYVYHDGEKFATTIYFAPHFKKEKQGETWVTTDKQIGYGIRFVKTEKANKENKEQLSIAFTYAEAELLALFLEDGLSHIFNAWLSENINRAKKIKENTTGDSSQSQESSVTNASPLEESPPF